MAKTVILGAEFDDQLRNDLLEVVRSMGAKTLDSDWSIVGSQELITAKLELRGRIIELASETYIGLSITGEEADVDEIAKQVSKERK